MAITWEDFNDGKDIFKKFLDFFDDAFNLLRKIVEFASEADILLTVAACSVFILGCEAFDSWTILKNQYKQKPLNKITIGVNTTILPIALAGVGLSLLFFVAELAGLTLAGMALFIPVSYLCLGAIFIIRASFAYYEYHHSLTEGDSEKITALSREYKTAIVEMIGGLMIVAGIWLGTYATFAGAFPLIVALIGVGVVLGIGSKIVNAYVRRKDQGEMLIAERDTRENEALIKRTLLKNHRVPDDTLSNSSTNLVKNLLGGDTEENKKTEIPSTKPLLYLQSEELSSASLQDIKESTLVYLLGKGEQKKYENNIPLERASQMFNSHETPLDSRQSLNKLTPLSNPPQD